MTTENQPETPLRTVIIAITIEEVENTPTGKWVLIHSGDQIKNRIQTMQTLAAPPESFPGALTEKLTELSERAAAGLHGANQ